MSEDPNELPPVPRPDTGWGDWRDQLAGYAEQFDVTPTRLVVGVVAAVVALLVGWRLLAAPAPPPEARLPRVTTSVPGAGHSSVGQASSTTIATDVVVHVAGAVTKPGVQRLKAGSRVVDAVDAAGGAVPEADLGRINLAAVLEDGQQVYVPKVGESGGGAVAAGGGSSGGADDAAGTGAPVHLNTATESELEALPGIGPALAAAIVAYRTEHGPFSSVDDLLEVRGIGQAKLEALREQAVL
jgi:competence protein ComEA